VVENRPSPLLWPLAYTTACTNVQAVITFNAVFDEAAAAAVTFSCLLATSMLVFVFLTTLASTLYYSATNLSRPPITLLTTQSIHCTALHYTTHVCNQTVLLLVIHEAVNVC